MIKGYIFYRMRYSWQSAPAFVFVYVRFATVNSFKLSIMAISPKRALLLLRLRHCYSPFSVFECRFFCPKSVPQNPPKSWAIHQFSSHCLFYCFRIVILRVGGRWLWKLVLSLWWSRHSWNYDALAAVILTVCFPKGLRRSLLLTVQHESKVFLGMR